MCEESNVATFFPKEQMILEKCPDGNHVLVSIFGEAGFRCWQKLKLSDLPNDFIGLDDLKRFGINRS